MDQLYFLDTFVDEIVRTGGAALAGAIPPPTREGLAEELLAAARRAARDTFGDATPIEVHLDGDPGELSFYQVLRVVEAPADPAREVTLAALDALGSDLGFEVGDEAILLIRYRHDATAAPDVGPLPAYSKALAIALTAELTAVLTRYFPAPSWPPGSLGALLASGGGWTRGTEARCGDWRVVVEGAFLAYLPTQVTTGWIEYGFLLAYERGGEVLWRCTPVDRVRRTEGDEPWLEAPATGDNDGVVRGWAALPTSEAARATFQRALQDVADSLAAGRAPVGAPTLHRLLMAAIRPPVEGGAWRWMGEALPRLLEGRVVSLPDGVEVGIAAVRPPAVGLREPGGASVSLVGRPHPPGDGRGAVLSLGRLGAAGLDLRGPDAAEERDLEAIVGVFPEWLGTHLAHHLARRAPDGSPSTLSGFSGHFPLVELLGQRLAWGPPGPPPVPPFDAAALERAARLLRPAPGESEHLLAAFEVGGWILSLRDDRQGRPWGSYCGVDLVPPEGGDAVAVMTVDAWNPPARAVVDGDAFAFRRFLEWLRGGILRGGHDRVLAWAPDDDDAAPGRVELRLSDWLLFGLPDVGDRFLVDWRAQWHVVNATTRIEDMAGIYGFTGATVDRLRDRDVPAWRRFLREVVFPHA